MSDEKRLAANKRRCVLLADAHHEVLKGTRKLLESMFETVVMVTDQESLMETARLMSPELIVVDMSLPSQARGNVVTRIVHEAPAIRIVVLSVDNDRNVIKQILASGAQAVVVKSSAGTDLIPAIEHALEGKTYVSPSVSLD